MMSGIIQYFFKSNILHERISTGNSAGRQGRSRCKNEGGIKVKNAAGVVFTVLRNRKGYSLIEISLVLALIAVLGGGVFILYNNRVAPATWSSSQYNTFNSVVAALNTSKNDRGGTYPAAASAGSITSGATTGAANALAPYVGSNSADISKWTYTCVSPNSTAVIAIVDSATPNSDAQGMLVNKINNAGNSALSAVITNTTTVTVTISGTTCS